MKIVTAEEMRLLEERCAEEGVTTGALMEQAGLAIAHAAHDILASAGVPPGDANVLVLVGPGNNGGDGLVAARHLSEWGHPVTAFLLRERSDFNEARVALFRSGVTLHTADGDPGLSVLAEQLEEARLVVDALLGTGRNRPIEGALAAVLDRLAEARSNKPNMLLLSVDLPTGLDADTGLADPLCPRADVTLALGLPKVGHMAFPGAALVGRLEVAGIGIPAHLADEASAREVITPEWVRSALPRRTPDSHKGTFGRTLVVAGSERYGGAAYLACMGAARAGAGLVTLAASENVLRVVAPKLIEATCLPLPSEDGALSPDAPEVLLAEAKDYQALLVGCGLGRSRDADRLVQQMLRTHRYPGTPLVLDADALNFLAETPEWWAGLYAETVVTPHPGEMSRLTGLSTAEVNAHRMIFAERYAAQWGVTVVLKGAYTVVASPQGSVRVSPFVNPALATAGSGDVLAGVIAGLIAQGAEPFDAAACGVYLHGAAGEQARQSMGDAGVLAGDLLPLLPLAMRAIREGGTSPRRRG